MYYISNSHIHKECDHMVAISTPPPTVSIRMAMINHTRFELFLLILTHGLKNINSPVIEYYSWGKLE